MTIFLLVLAIPLIIVVLIYAAIYIYLRPLFHKPEPLPYDNIEDFGLRPAHLFEGPSVHSKLIDAILSIYKQDGLRFSFFEIIFKSKHYPLAAMWKDFIHEPDLRWALILCGIPNLIAQDRGALGFSLPMPRSRLFNIQYYTQYDIGLVVSELIHGLEIGHADGVSWRSSLILFIETAVGSLVKEAVHYPGTDTVVHRYCNDPQIAHPDVNAILMRHYFHWPDHDSTSIIMAALQKYLQYSDKHPQEFDAGLREDVRSLLKNPGLLDLLDNSYGPVLSLIHI